MRWEDMTSWAALGGTLTQAGSNLVIVVAVIVSVWTAMTDPTAKGTGDSARARPSFGLGVVSAGGV